MSNRKLELTNDYGRTLTLEFFHGTLIVSILDMDADGRDANGFCLTPNEWDRMVKFVGRHTLDVVTAAIEHNTAGMAEQADAPDLKSGT